VDVAGVDLSKYADKFRFNLGMKPGCGGTDTTCLTNRDFDATGAMHRKDGAALAALAYKSIDSGDRSWTNYFHECSGGQCASMWVGDDRKQVLENYRLAQWVLIGSNVKVLVTSQLRSTSQPPSQWRDGVR
jgi:hypothetical protein